MIKFSEEPQFSLYSIAAGISEAVDIVSPDLNNHHHKVAYIAYNIAKKMNMQNEEINDIVLASMLHDIGAFASEERLKVVYAFFDDSECNQHQIMGYMILKNFEPFRNAALLIKNHHAHFDKSSNDIPLGSYVIHLADRLSILCNKNKEILKQVPGIMESIERNQSKFHPDALAALRRLAKMEFFWIETFSIPFKNVLPERMYFPKKTMSLDSLRNLAKVISHIVDYRSSYTATHSRGVAAVALKLTTICGFSEKECRLMEIAGYLHDIGKLAISSDILEKNGVFNHEEFNEMRKHSYYTYSILSKIEGFEQIAMWASYHHERLDGNGYPFHVKGEDFTRLARILAVADIMTAITEDRPYRSGLGSEMAIDILYNMVNDGGIDESIVDIVRDHFSEINEVRASAQKEEIQVYNTFYDASANH